MFRRPGTKFMFAEELSGVGHRACVSNVSTGQLLATKAVAIVNLVPVIGTGRD